MSKNQKPNNDDRRQPVTFQRSWQRVAFIIFAVSWGTMLIPMLLFPVSRSAAILTLILLGTGVSAIIMLLCHVFFRSLSPKPRETSQEFGNPTAKSTDCELN